MSSRIKELKQEEFPLQIIQDLGINNGKRIALFKCMYCDNTYVTRIGDVKRGKSTRCKACVSNNRSIKLMSDITEFINEANYVHKNKYDYTKSKYTGVDNKLIIVCPTHGEFEQRPHQHLRGEGCKKCGYSTVSNALIKDFDELVLVAKNIHNDKYKYIKESYKGSVKKMDILCPTHGIFSQALSLHIHSKHGCPACKPGGFASNLPGVLYYIKLIDYNLYKIGVTNKSVAERFNSEKLNYEVLFSYYFNNGRDCIDVETLILNNYSEYLYTGMSILQSGNTEIFNCDIFKGEYNAIKSEIHRKNLSSERNVSRCQYKPAC